MQSIIKRNQLNALLDEVKIVFSKIEIIHPNYSYSCLKVPRTIWDSKIYEETGL